MSTTDGWLKLNFASCVIRQTRSVGVLVLCSNWNMVFVNFIYDMVVDAQFRKFYGGPFARVLYLFLMKDFGRWLPWVLPGSTGRFYKDDVVHNHSAHRFYITRIQGGRVTICMILIHVKLLINLQRCTRSWLGKAWCWLKTVITYKTDIVLLPSCRVRAHGVA